MLHPRHQVAALTVLALAPGGTARAGEVSFIPGEWRLVGNGLGLKPEGVAGVRDDLFFVLCRGWICPDGCDRHPGPDGGHEAPCRLYAFERTFTDGKPGWQVQGLDEDLPHGLKGLVPASDRSFLSRTREGAVLRIWADQDPGTGFWRVASTERLELPAQHGALAGPVKSVAMTGQDEAVLGFARAVALMPMDGGDGRWLIKPPAKVEAKGEGTDGQGDQMLVAANGRGLILAVDARTRCAFGLDPASGRTSVLVKREQWPEGFRPQAAGGFGSQFFVAGPGTQGAGMFCALCPEPDGRTWSVRPLETPVPAGGLLEFSPSGHLHLCDPEKGCLHRVQNSAAGLRPAEEGKPARQPDPATLLQRLSGVSEYLKACLAAEGQIPETKGQAQGWGKTEAQRARQRAKDQRRKARQRGQQAPAPAPGPVAAPAPLAEPEAELELGELAKGLGLADQLDSKGARPGPARSAPVAGPPVRPAEPLDKIPSGEVNRRGIAAKLEAFAGGSGFAPAFRTWRDQQRARTPQGRIPVERLLAMDLVDPLPVPRERLPEGLDRFAFTPDAIEKVVRWMLVNAGQANRPGSEQEWTGRGGRELPRYAFGIYENPEDTAITLELFRLDACAGRIDPALARRLAAKQGRTGITTPEGKGAKFAYGLTVVVDPEERRFLLIRPGGQQRAYHYVAEEAPGQARAEAKAPGEAKAPAEASPSPSGPPATAKAKALNPRAKVFVPQGVAEPAPAQD